jgi:hypothetical protein
VTTYMPPNWPCPACAGAMRAEDMGAPLQAAHAAHRAVTTDPAALRDAMAAAWSDIDQQLDESWPHVEWAHAGATRRMRAYDAADALLAQSPLADLAALPARLHDALDEVAGKPTQGIDGLLLAQIVARLRALTPDTRSST